MPIFIIKICNSNYDEEYYVSGLSAEITPCENYSITDNINEAYKFNSFEVAWLVATEIKKNTPWGVVVAQR